MRMKYKLIYPCTELKLSVSISRNSNKHPRSQTYLPQPSLCMTGARAPTKHTSGMTRVSKSCMLVVEPYCFNSYSSSVWRIARETEERGSHRERTTWTTTMLSILDPLKLSYPFIGQ